MKKSSILSLIRYHAEGNERAFRNEAYEIAEEFDRQGETQLAQYIAATLADENAFVPPLSEKDSVCIRKVPASADPLPLPDRIRSDVTGIVNAVGRDVGVHKFLFQGAPGTGKTETAKYIAGLLERDLFVVDFAFLIDSKLGQTMKNIAELFDEINNLRAPEKAVILFDEIDALALDRRDAHDHREMARATTAVFKGLEGLNDRILLIATTNLYRYFDKALVRRFDAVIDFNRYSRDDLLAIAESILEGYLPKFKTAARNMRLFKKIIMHMEEIPYPAELENLIKTSLAFSAPDEEYEYLRRLYAASCGDGNVDAQRLRAQGFTQRDIEILSKEVKSELCGALALR